MPEPTFLLRRVLRALRLRGATRADAAAVAAVRHEVADVGAELRQLRNELASLASRVDGIEVHTIALADQRHQDAWAAAQIRHEHVLTLLSQFHADSEKAAQIRHEHLVALFSARFRRPGQ
jgi:hypothetical protein